MLSLPLQLSRYMLELRARPKPRVPRFLRRLSKGRRVNVDPLWPLTAQLGFLLESTARSTPATLTAGKIQSKLNRKQVMRKYFLRLAL